MGRFIRCLAVAAALLTCIGCAAMTSSERPATVHEWMGATEQVHP